MSFVIWGYSTSTKSLPLGRQRCQSCGRITHHEQMESDRQFELFFVPIFSLGRSSWVRCKACGFDSAAGGAVAETPSSGQAAPAAPAAGSSSGTKLLIAFLIIFFAAVALVLIASLLFGALMVFGFLYMIFAPLFYMLFAAISRGMGTG